MLRFVSIGLVAVTVISAAAVQTPGLVGPRWSKAERETLRSLSLASLGPLPADPSNRYADDTSAARLGQRLFFDARLSGNGKVACVPIDSDGHLAPQRRAGSHVLFPQSHHGSRRPEQALLG